MTQPLVLMIDDQAPELVVDLGLAIPAFEFQPFESGKPAIEWLDENWDELDRPVALLLDVTMPPEYSSNAETEGLAVLGELKQRFEDLPVVMYSQSTELDIVITAIKGGAFWHAPKTSAPEEIEALLEQAIEKARETRRLREQSELQAAGPVGDAIVGTSAEPFHGMIGSSFAMRELFQRIARVGPHDCPVLIHGPTGSGKELVARAIHNLSGRHGKPYITVNCNVLQGDLLRSELFGHVKNAFTGANEDRPGAIREADGGTLFLDEIADLDPPAQGMLLRALENHEVSPVGALGAPHKIDVRFIGASHKDLRALVEAGEFREDLFYRIAGYRLEVPPLADRTSDVIEIAENFLAHEKPARRLSREACEALLTYPWPGNVRELFQRLRQALIDGSGEEIRASDLRLDLESSLSPPGEPQRTQPTPEDRLEEEAREYLTACYKDEDRDKSLAELQRTRGEDFVRVFVRVALSKYNGRQAASALGFNYDNWRNWLRNHNIQVRAIRRRGGA